MLYALLTVLLVALDQTVKYLVRAHIPLGGSVPFLPHVMDFTYVQNTGAAFSIFAQHTWLLTLLSLAVSVLLILALVRGWVTRTRPGRLCLTLVLAGAVGNLIDRALFGFVTDMFETLFIHFAVFNVADICVVVGGIGFCAYYLFLYDKLEGKEAPR
ncbi:signal peptidase II [Pseudoflavonifractor sp. MSJ-37]|uniref:signal peptidase II n=1 Tax=Pseudoflavonifractor sp. MSJ-37 TaxID=2841531 RepID=UPI001C101E3C|nr:signal peptidase II [Pseudoflavonifractor sp. MSJ-37]MBU5435285.1 signal peptidase II [Pseudoflavonifractor sp. MSJ-37]